MQASSSRSLVAARSYLLRQLRVPVLNFHERVDRPFPLSRLFSSEGHKTFLNKTDVTDRVISVVKQFQKVDPAKVSTAAHFHKDLGLDSLDIVEVVMALEEEFALEIPDNEADKIDSCGAAIEYIAAHPMAK